MTFFSDARDKIISEGADKTWWNKAKALYLEEIYFLSLLSFKSFFLSSRPHGALFSQLQQSFYSEDQLALQESTKKLVDEVDLLYFFLFTFLNHLDFCQFSFLTFPHPGDQPVRQGVGG